MPGYNTRFGQRLGQSLGGVEDFITIGLNLANTGLNAYSKISEIDRAKDALSLRKKELAANIAALDSAKKIAEQQAQQQAAANIAAQQAAANIAAQQAANAPVVVSSEWVPGIPNWGVALGGLVVMGGVVYVATRKRKR
jgi:predicted ribosome quality control (RQC) complex YloA/Tae2 family protein